MMVCVRVFGCLSCGCGCTVGGVRSGVAVGVVGCAGGDGKKKKKTLCHSTQNVAPPHTQHTPVCVPCPPCTQTPLQLHIHTARAHALPPAPSHPKNARCSRPSLARIRCARPAPACRLRPVRPGCRRPAATPRHLLQRGPAHQVRLPGRRDVGLGHGLAAPPRAGLLSLAHPGRRLEPAVRGTGGGRGHGCASCPGGC